MKYPEEVLTVSKKGKVEVRKADDSTWSAYFGKHSHSKPVAC